MGRASLSYLRLGQIDKVQSNNHLIRFPQEPGANDREKRSMITFWTGS
jgi:hypothetical protein